MLLVWLDRDPVEGIGAHVVPIAACPSSFHEFEGPEAIPYDVEGYDQPLLDVQHN